MYIPHKKRPWLPWLFGLLLIGGLLLAFYLLGNVLTPFIVAAVLAYILDPLVSKIEKLGIHRSRASMWVMLAAGHRSHAGRAIPKHCAKNPQTGGLCPNQTGAMV